MRIKLGRQPKIRTASADADTILHHAEAIRNAHQAMANEQMEHATLYKAAEREGVHRGALALAMRLERMSNAKRADWLRGWRDVADAFQFDAQLDLFERNEEAVSATSAAA